MPENSPGFEIAQSGSRISFEFTEKRLPGPTVIAELQKHLQTLVARHDAKTLSLKAGNLQMIPSQLLGFLVEFKRRGLEVELINPSEIVLETLRAVDLEKYFTVKRAG
ncbi:MAG: STAS domain-containing protein [Planctomycetes bacterium]|nr:STAS domain-containing protein [Planctomycetota bacterium]